MGEMTKKFMYPPCGLTKILMDIRNAAISTITADEMVKKALSITGNRNGLRTDR
jgi:hypothetical protein